MQSVTKFLKCDLHNNKPYQKQEPRKSTNFWSMRKHEWKPSENKNWRSKTQDFKMFNLKPTKLEQTWSKQKEGRKCNTWKVSKKQCSYSFTKTNNLCYIIWQCIKIQIKFSLTLFHNFMLEKYKFHWLGKHDTQVLVACTCSKG